MAASAGSGNGSAALTLCVNGDNRDEPSPFQSLRAYVVSEAVQATNASDRSSSVMCNGRRSITTTTGPDREVDYALAQCRADVPAGECSSCLGACLDTIGYMCDSAAVRYAVCLLRFGKQDFSIFDVNEYTVSVFDGRNQPGLPKDVTTGLLSRVVANATVNGSRTAAGIADYPAAAAAGARASVYGLAQCITQMSAPDCRRCLSDAVFRLSEEFNSSAGMQVLRPSCMVRYATSLFFNTSLLPLTHVSVPDGAGAAPPAGSASVPTAKGRRAQVIAGIGGGAAFLALAALVALWCIRRRWKSKSATGGGNYSYQTLVDATGNFSQQNLLGSGGCGVVYKGILQNKQEIAVKKLVRKELKELEREVSLVGQLQHENLVKFLGHCF